MRIVIHVMQYKIRQAGTHQIMRDNNTRICCDTDLLEDIVGDEQEGLVGLAAAPALAAPLGEQDAVKQLASLLQLFRHVHVVVHPEDLWQLGGRQVLRARGHWHHAGGGVNRGLVRASLWGHWHHAGGGVNRGLARAAFWGQGALASRRGVDMGLVRASVLL